MGEVVLKPVSALALFECATATPSEGRQAQGARGGEEHEGLQGEQGNPSAEAALIWILP